MSFKKLAALLLLVCAASAAAGPVKRLPSARRKANQEQTNHPEIARITVDELILMLGKKRPVTIIDVRSLDSYDSKIKGALEIPLDQIKARLKEIPRNKEIVTYCA